MRIHPQFLCLIGLCLQLAAEGQRGGGGGGGGGGGARGVRRRSKRLSGRSCPRWPIGPRRGGAYAPSSPLIGGEGGGVGRPGGVGVGGEAGRGAAA
eukprot:715640-Pyramimonas_sp.AAC.1